MRIAIAYDEKRSAAESDAEFDTRDAIADVAALVGELGHDAVPIDVTGSPVQLDAAARAAGHSPRAVLAAILDAARDRAGASPSALSPRSPRFRGVPSP